MIKVYLDESGIHEGAPVCTVAGYAAPWKAWKRIFIPKWDRALKDCGIQDVGFHAKDFFARADKKYQGWTEADTTECFNLLVNVINQSDLRPVGGCIVSEVFWKLNPDERRYLTGGRFDEKRDKWLTSGAPKTPYHFPIQQAVIDAGMMASPDNKVHFVHDQQKQYAPLVLERFIELKQTLRIKDNLGDFVFASRLEATPLQAADLIAYLATKYAERRLETGNPTVEPSYEFHRLMERKNEMRFLDESSVSLLLKGCPKKFRTTQFPSIPSGV